MNCNADESSTEPSAQVFDVRRCAGREPRRPALAHFAPTTSSKLYTQNTCTFDSGLPACDIINLRVGLLTGRFDTALFINNITDEVAYLALDQERGTRARVGFLINDPRTYGVSTRFTF